MSQVTEAKNPDLKNRSTPEQAFLLFSRIRNDSLGEKEPSYLFAHSSLEESYPLFRNLAKFVPKIAEPGDLREQKMTENMLRLTQ